MPRALHANPDQRLCQPQSTRTIAPPAPSTPPSESAQNLARQGPAREYPAYASEAPIHPPKVQTMARAPSLSTRCVHGGHEPDPNGALHTPLYTDTTFAFSDTASLTAVMDGQRPGNLYTRFGHNPTIRATETQLAHIEGAPTALVFGSGMAAISATLLAHCAAGDRILCLGDVYGGTFELLTKVMPPMGIETDFLLGDELAQLPETLTKRTRVLYVETPTNPTLEVFDIQKLATIAHAAGALLFVDGTFATPVNQNPLALGADIVLHSTTKYLGGHSDVTGGVVLATDALLAPVWAVRKNLGQVMAPEVAFSLARSLRTLALRVEAQNIRALELARRLESHPAVARVYYPGLSSHPNHDVAVRQMRGFGGIVTFTVHGGGDKAAQIIEALKLVTMAPSLGGVESLATQPITTTHRGLTPEERARRGIADAMIRLSVGIEDVEDLWADLEQALAQ